MSTTVDGLGQSTLGAHNVLPQGPPSGLGGPVFVGVTLALVVGAFGALVLRYRKVSI